MTLRSRPWGLVPCWIWKRASCPRAKGGACRWRGVATQLMREHLAGGGIMIAAVHDPLDLPCRTLDVEAAT